MTIISSNDREVISDFLKRNDLFCYFNLVLGAESGRNKKKKLKTVLKKFQIPKEKTYFITDTIRDLKEVKDLGIKTMAVTWGYHAKSKLKKENPDFIVDSTKELLKVFL